jgi:hypothetical protein
LESYQANGETNDSNIINFFYFTSRDNISKWGEIFMQSHLKYTFQELEVVFGKCYQKVQNDEQV